MKIRKIANRVLFVLLSTCLFPYLLNSQQEAKVLDTVETGRMALVYVYLPIAFHTRGQLTAESNRYLSLYSKTVNLDVKFYSNSHTFESDLSTKGFHVNKQEWQRRLSADLSTPPLPFAELLKVGRNVTLRIVPTQGHFTDHILRGSNTFRVQVGSHQLFLMHVGVRTNVVPVPVIGNRLIPLTIPALYYRTEDCIDDVAAQSIAKELYRKFGTSQVDVILSPNSWFVYHDEYPTISPFDPRRSIPSDDEIEKPWEVVCGIQYGNRCRRVPRDAKCPVALEER